MVTRVRIEAMGRTAARVEEDLLRVFGLIVDKLDSQATRGEQVISRDCAAPIDDYGSFEGRLLVYMNVAPDSEQIAKLAALSPVAFAEAPGIVESILVHPPGSLPDDEPAA